MAEFFDEQIDAGRRPEQFGRIWIHTHPGDSAQPSHVDEETFSRVFGPCDWAVMFILAREGETYCRLRFRAGPGGAFEIPVAGRFSRPFCGIGFRGLGRRIRRHCPKSGISRSPDCRSSAIRRRSDCGG